MPAKRARAPFALRETGGMITTAGFYPIAAWHQAMPVRQATRTGCDLHLRHRQLPGRDHATTQPGKRSGCMAQTVVAVPESVAVPREEPSGQLTILIAPPRSRGRGGVPLTESFRSSLFSLSANIMRTLLTMLGIIIGVGAVIALLAI